MGRTAGILVGLVLFVLAPSVQAQTPFSRWSAVVVAGDWHAHSGGPTEAFDNARRDVADTLAGLGFARTAIRQYSVRPERYPGQGPEPAEITAIHQGLKDSAQTARSGCLFYISSHGGPEGALLGEDLLRPSRLAALIDDACPARPAVVVISACFSGVFIPALQKPNRMILTAARPDRASFGCGESDRYPFFDDCFLSSAKGARDFIALGSAVQACVARKEVEVGAAPPSEPQVWIGPALRPFLPLYAFDRRKPPER
ncbi:MULTISPECIES: C13 family peptidase [unclassified Caulobacter]|uniref:C13 family peptidase n=1 Tax=unclassified Caulobacter TaxID=2648921 RepID=UPI000D3BFB7C|nr:MULTISPECIES: C13 family peptidase [unclassified Caulobacter]PTS87269.1 peptidase C13 [Caulobacter sp. HMWF009]PTT10200.1 peptidase C13 [Caulobacter sp. HMWF025]